MSAPDAVSDLFQLVMDLRKRVTELEQALHAHLTPEFTAYDEDEEPGEED